MAIVEAGTGSVAQPALFLPLRELTNRSALIGQLKLGIFHPWEDEYKYTWQGTEKHATVLKCLLVDLTDPTCYCHAEYKKQESRKHLQSRSE
jgi:hypothetical protein